MLTTKDVGLVSEVDRTQSEIKTTICNVNIEPLMNNEPFYFMIPTEESFVSVTIPTPSIKKAGQRACSLRSKTWGKKKLILVAMLEKLNCFE